MWSLSFSVHDSSLFHQRHTASPSLISQAPVVLDRSKLLTSVEATRDRFAAVVLTVVSMSHSVAR
jgi:hypothetical protein